MFIITDPLKGGASVRKWLIKFSLCSKDRECTPSDLYFSEPPTLIFTNPRIIVSAGYLHVKGRWGGGIKSSSCGLYRPCDFHRPVCAKIFRKNLSVSLPRSEAPFLPAFLKVFIIIRPSSSNSIRPFI
jgi:hypothetical protein